MCCVCVVVPCVLRFWFSLFDRVFVVGYCFHVLNWSCFRDLRCVFCLLVVWFGFVSIDVYFQVSGVCCRCCVVVLLVVCLWSFCV